MPILGVGMDIVETARIERLSERSPAFLERVFTSVELEYCLSKRCRYMHLAARFAAKEAVAKALGRSFSWKDVEVINNPRGKPEVVLYGRARQAAGAANVHLSISHTSTCAAAVAVVEV